MIHLSACNACATWEPGCGHLVDLQIGGAPVLGPAPWRQEAEIQANAAIPMVDRRLGGTFVCAPFGQDDLDHGPPHGFAANGRWHVIRRAPGSVVARRDLTRGAITAQIALRDDHPVLYQTHILDLDAPCTFAHHPILSMAAGGRLSMSAVRAVLTFAAEAPVLPQGARTGTLYFDGPPSHDLRDVPVTVSEDFATVVTDQPDLAWTALARHAEGDTVLCLRVGRQLPVTNLWFSNGARRTAPWLGRYGGRLGIEDGRNAGAEGFGAALAGRTRVGAEGVPTAFPPGRHVIPHALVHLAQPLEVRDIVIEPGHLVLSTDAGTRAVPFDEGHFA
ncbi:MAG: hypothetical protein AAFY65_17355 [Pseudomonadota bacterium]